MAALTVVFPALQHLTFQPQVGGEVLINFVPNANSIPLEKAVDDFKFILLIPSIYSVSTAGF